MAHTTTAERSTRTIVRVVASVLFVALLEVLVFNFPFWESLTFGERSEVSYTASAGLRDAGDSFVEPTDKKDSYIELDCKGAHVNNVEIQLRFQNPMEPSLRYASGTTMPISFSVTDAGNAEFLALPAVDYCDRFASTHFVRLHLEGASQAIRIYFDKPGEIFAVEKVAVNSVRPFDVSLPRVLILALAVALFWAFRPSSALYRIPFDTTQAATRVGTGAVALVAAVGMVLLVVQSGVEHSAEYDEIVFSEEGGYVYDFNQYNHLADAIIAGSASLDLPVSDTLRNLDNPYDRNARMKALAETHEHAYMDYAYYEGAYYCYFGPLPALLTFVPYKLVTGHDLRTDRVVALFAMLCVASLTLLSSRLFSRFFRGRNGSLGVYLLGLISLLVGCGIANLVFVPTTYSVPILSALFFASAGLSTWVAAKRTDGTLSVARLATGGLLVALTLGCRPSLVLVTLLAFPLFAAEIRQTRQFFARSATAVTNTLAVMAPFIVVALPVMVYNFVRFGSVFDFGATYNITGADMVHRSFSIARIPGCLFEYLFQPPNVNLTFPYLHGIDMSTDFQGLWFYEPHLGGFFAFAPVCVVLVLLWLKRDAVKRVGLVPLYWSMLALALVLVVFDFQMASITSRYFGDFGWLLLLASWLVAWAVVHEDENHARMDTLFGIALVALTAFGCMLTLWSFLSEGRYGILANACPGVYYAIKSWLSIFF